MMSRIFGSSEQHQEKGVDNDETSAVFRAPTNSKKVQKSPEWFGVDFGNSNICVSYYLDNVFHVVQLEAKTTTMPAIITLNEEDFFVGNDAQNIQTKKATKLTMFDFRRILSVNNLPDATFPFSVTKKLDYESTLDPKFSRVPLIRAIAILFQWIKNKVKTDLEMDMMKVVITTPTRFDMYQRQTIVNAAKIADLKVMHIINEPTAVAISYFIANPNDKKEFCVFDFGGSKLDIAIVKTDSKNIELVDCVGDLQLGGRDFDECLFNHVCGIISKQHPGITLKAKDHSHIRQECIKAKINLGTTSAINIDIDLSQEDVTIPMTVKEFESLCSYILKCIESQITILKNRNPSVNTVVLIGGSTRIPMVQNMLSKYFGIINKSLNADEAVAKGAAAFPVLLSKTLDKININDFVPWDKKIISDATKMEYFIDNEGVIQQKVYSKATNVEFDLNREKEHVQELFNKKEEKASKHVRKQIPDVPQEPPQIYNDLETLIQKSQALTLAFYKNDIDNVFKAARIYKTKFDNFNAYGHQNAGDLENRVRRVETYLCSLELLSSMRTLKQHKKEMQDLEGIVEHLYQNGLNLGEDGLNRYNSHLYLMKFWFSLEENIKMFESNLKGQRISENKTVLPKIKEEAKFLKNAISNFGSQKEAYIPEHRYAGIRALVDQFLQQYPSPPVVPVTRYNNSRNWN